MNSRTSRAWLSLAVLPAFVGAATPATPTPADVASALIDARGSEVGLVRLREAGLRRVLVTLEVRGLEPGAYDVVIHERGRCETPTFESAGGPVAAAGARLLRFEVPGPGRVEVERALRDVSLTDGEPNSLVSGDGTAFVVYALAQSAEGETVTETELRRGAAVACAAVVAR